MSQTKRKIVLDVRLHVSSTEVHYFGLPWPTPPQQWTRRDMMDAAARVAPLLKPAGRVFVRFVNWDETEGLRFSVVTDDDGPWVDVRVARLPRSVALTITDFHSMHQYGEWAEIAPNSRARLAKRVIGGSDSQNLIATVRTPGFLNQNREAIKEGNAVAMAKDERAVRRLVAKAAKSARAAATAGGAR